MSLFSQTLSAFVQQRQMKIYQLANLSGIERSWLQKMLTGTRKPSDQAQVLRLAHALSLTHMQTQQLVEAFRILEMGEENWRRRQAVRRLLESFHLDEGPTGLEGPHANSSPLHDQKVQVLCSAVQLNRAVHTILLQEMRAPDGFVDLLVQPDYPFLLDCLTAIPCEETPIRHFFCLNSSPCAQTDNLNQLCRMVPPLLHCHNYQLYGYYDHPDSLFGCASFLPNLLLTSRCLLQMSPDFSCGLLSRQPQLLNLARRFFQAQQFRSFPIFGALPAVEEFLCSPGDQGRSGSSCCMMGHPFAFLPLRTWMCEKSSPSHAAPDPGDLASKPEVAHCCFSLEQLKSLVQNFGQEDNESSAPKRLPPPFTRGQVFQMLQSVCQCCEEGRYQLHLIKASGFSIPPGLCVQTIPPHTASLLFAHPQKGPLAFSVQSLVLAGAICDFVDYLLGDEEMSCSPEQSLRLLQEMIRNISETFEKN